MRLPPHFFCSVLYHTSMTSSDPSSSMDVSRLFSSGPAGDTALTDSTSGLDFSGYDIPEAPLPSTRGGGMKWTEWFLIGFVLVAFILVLLFVFYSPPQSQSVPNLVPNLVPLTFAPQASPSFGVTADVSAADGDVFYADYAMLNSNVATPGPFMGKGIVANLVRISLPSRYDCLALGEIEVYDDKGHNIASLGVPKSSSVYNNVTLPNKALDGRYDTFFLSSCKDVPYYELAFPTDVVISKIVLYNRRDTPAALDKLLGVVLDLWNSKNNRVFASEPISSVQPMYVFDFYSESFPPVLEKSIAASTIRFGLSKTAPEFLGISSFKILNESGEDIAPSAMIRSSSIYEPKTSASNMIDGNHVSFFQSSYETSPWVEFSFPSDILVSQIHIYPRSDVGYERILSGVLQLWDNSGVNVFTSKPVQSVTNIYSFDFRNGIFPM